MTANTANVSKIQTRWLHVCEQREAIRDAMLRVAHRSHGPVRKHYQALARRLNRASAGDWRSNDGDLLTLCLPILAGSEGTDGFDRVLAIYEERRNRRHQLVGLLSGLAFPLINATACLILFSAFCVTVVSEFQRMFDEFGLELPAPTKLLFLYAHYIERHWIIFSIILGLLIFCALASHLSARWFGTLTLIQRLSRWLTPSDFWVGESAADLQTLLAGDIDRPAALQVAAELSGVGWLRRELTRIATATELSGGQRVGVSRRLRWCQGGLLPLALQLPPPACRDGLRLTRKIAGDGQRSWLTLMSFLAIESVVLVIGLVVGLTVLALFAPLVGLVSGLS